MRDEALQWDDQFFKQRRSNIDTIWDTANHRLPQRSYGKRVDIQRQVMTNFEVREKFDEMKDLLLVPTYMHWPA